MSALEGTGDCCGRSKGLVVSTEVGMKERMYESAAASQHASQNLRDVVRFCINTFRAFYAGDVGAAFTTVAAATAASDVKRATASSCRGPNSLAAREASPRDPAMGNLQSEAKKKGKKGKGAADGTTSTPGSVADGLDDATDTGDDGETGDSEETPARKMEVCQRRGVDKRPFHKRQAPKPPGSTETKVSYRERFERSSRFYRVLLRNGMSAFCVLR